MSQNNQQMRIRILTAILASVISIGFVTAAIAARLGIDSNITAPAKIHTDNTAYTDAHMKIANNTYSNVRWGDGVLRSTERTAPRKRTTRKV